MTIPLKGSLPAAPRNCRSYHHGMQLPTAGGLPPPLPATYTPWLLRCQQYSGENPAAYKSDDGEEWIGPMDAAMSQAAGAIRKALINVNADDFGIEACILVCKLAHSVSMAY